MRIIACGVLFLVGCGESGSNPSIARNVAMLSVDESTFKVAYASSDHQDDLAAILNGDQPRQFHWALITLPSQIASSSNLASGLSIDPTDSRSSLTFAQVYSDVCNPARENFNSCLLYERYSAGMDGLTGRVELQSDGKTITGAIDLTWQGITDRFGDPPQWHKHGTLADIEVAVDAKGIK